MSIDHSYVQVAADGAGKKIGNVQQTDPDGNVVQLQKTPIWDPEDGTDSGGLRIEDGAARTRSVDGGHASLGATTDASATGDGTVIGLLKRLRALMAGGLPAALGAGGGVKVDGSGTALPVDGSGVTQPVSASSLPLPSGAATSAKQDTLIGHVDGIEALLGTIDADTGALAAAQEAGLWVRALGMIVDDDTSTFTAADQAYTVGFGGGVTSVAFELAGTWVGTLVFEGRVGASGAWSAITAIRLSDGVLVGSAAANGVYVVASNGLREMQVRVSAYTSGTVDLHVTYGYDPTLTRLTAPLPAGSASIGQVTANAGTDLNTSELATDATLGTTNTEIGAVNETAPGTDTASSGLNGRLQRIAQRLTSLIALLPATLGAGGGLKVDGSGTALPVSGTFWQATQPTSIADGSHVTIGAKADAKSTATDTTAITAMSVWKQISASVQAIATSVAGTLTVATHAVTQSGTWTVQPGNTANTTAWKVDGSAVTQPVSGTVTINAIPAGTNNIGDVDVLTVPADPFGANADAAVVAGATGSISAKLRAISRDLVANIVLAAGTNTIGKLAANSGVDIGDVDVTSLPNVTLAAGTNTNEVVGDAAHGASVAGNPILNGFEARTSDGTAVTNGQAVRGSADSLGKQVMLVGAIHDLQSNGTANYTNTTAADVIAAAGAGIRIAVTSVLVTNAHATVGTKVEIRDGTTVKIQGYAAAAGGGFAHNGGGRPLFISTANTAVTARCVTTGADVDVSIGGYRLSN